MKRGATIAFEAQAKAKAAPGRPQRVVVFGDSSKDSEGQKKVAYQTHRLEPDMVLITGDIVYFQGRVGEYRAQVLPDLRRTGRLPDGGRPPARLDPLRRRARATTT